MPQDLCADDNGGIATMAIRATIPAPISVDISWMQMNQQKKTEARRVCSSRDLGHLLF